MANKASRDALKNKGKRDAYTFDPEDLVLVTDEKHPLYDERVHLPVDENLVLNMMYELDGAPQGVLEAVRTVRNRETGDIEVAVGRQRVKAAREANKRLRKAGKEPFWVPCLMVDRPSAHRSMGMIISENAQRQGETPLGAARKMQRYLNIGRDHKELAIMFGMSEATIKNHLLLLQLPAVIEKALEAGKISVSDAYKMAKLNPDEAKKMLEELLEHAPRTPGKKRSPNARKAREITSGKKEKDSDAEPKGISKRAEDSVATDIAAWLSETYEDLEPEVIKAIRSGKWREIRGEA